jgi:hypothetical protein
LAEVLREAVRAQPDVELLPVEVPLRIAVAEAVDIGEVKAVPCCAGSTQRTM